MAFRPLLIGADIVAQGIKDVPVSPAPAEPIFPTELKAAQLVIWADSSGDVANSVPNATARIAMKGQPIDLTLPGLRRNRGVVFDSGIDEGLDVSDYYCLCGAAGMKLSWWAIGKIKP